MASIFGHAAASLCLKALFPNTKKQKPIWFLCVCCAIFPDIDTLGFEYGISYDSFWGHRGFTHSILGSAIIALLACIPVRYVWKFSWKQTKIYMLLFFLSAASHGVLDAMTGGGKGVAFFSPWENSRYFFPWRPILVSPLGISRFFSEWGIKILLNELIWIGTPSILIILSIKYYRKFIKRAQS